MYTKSIERLSELMSCDTVEKWRDLIFRFAKGLGYEQTRLAILPNPHAPIEAEHAFQHGNYAADWISKYTEQKMHHVDPTFAHCMDKSVPLVWTPEIFSTRRQKEMYEEACKYGVRSGVTLPIHGAHGEFGIVCFVTDQKPGERFQRKVLNTLPELSYLRDVILETSLPFIKALKSRRESSLLTPRELECVKWCAAGKSSWDIAQILHCSEAAVNFHFGNLRRKFGVKSRQQVVVKAMTRGLIHP